MIRRSFLKNTAIVGGTLLSPFCAPNNVVNPKYKLGYQLYSIRDEMGKDPVATLKALRKMGYEDFELYGFDDVTGKYYGFRASEFKDILDNLGLTVTSGHYGFSPYLEQSDDDLKMYVDRCIVAAKTIDSKYLTWPFMEPQQRTIDKYKLAAQKFNLIGEQATKAGLGFAFHNHGYEFEDQDGENGYDIILNETDPELVKLQMDMYWVRHSSNYTPQELIDLQPGRYVMWHIKDMDKVTRNYTELGNGSIDYLKLLPDPVKSGLEFYYIEQGGNYSINSKESAATSARYLKENLQKYL